MAPARSSAPSSASAWRGLTARPVGLGLGDDVGLVAPQGQSAAHQDVRRFAALGQVAHEAAQGRQGAVLPHAQGVGEQPLTTESLHQPAGEEALGEDVVGGARLEHGAVTAAAPMS